MSDADGGPGWQEATGGPTEQAGQTSGASPVPNPSDILGKVANVLTSHGSDKSIQEIKEENDMSRYEAHLYRMSLHVTNSSESNALTDGISAVVWYVADER